MVGTSQISHPFKSLAGTIEVSRDQLMRPSCGLFVGTSSWRISFNDTLMHGCTSISLFIQVMFISVGTWAVLQMATVPLEILPTFCTPFARMGSTLTLPKVLSSFEQLEKGSLSSYGTGFAGPNMVPGFRYLTHHFACRWLPKLSRCDHWV